VDAGRAGRLDARWDIFGQQVFFSQRDVTGRRPKQQLTTGCHRRSHGETIS
jgi:hypothetical protein